MHVDTGWRFPEEAPAMTEEESLDIAAERARKAAEEREKQRRLLEEGILEPDRSSFDRSLPGDGPEGTSGAQTGVSAQGKNLGKNPGNKKDNQ